VVLVDTSAWIEVFRRPSRLAIESVVEFDDIVTCLPVVQEVLQGFTTEDAFRVGRDAMLALPMVESPLGEAVVVDAVDLYRRARRAGLTIRSGVDCLIAACAIRHDLVVLHHDQDFPALAKVSALRHRAIPGGRAERNPLHVGCGMPR
jgi:predicted nucleic acid-binding protein